MKLTRGNGTKEEEITIYGFLTTNVENNEKADALNSIKVLVGFKIR